MNQFQNIDHLVKLKYIQDLKLFLTNWSKDVIFNHIRLEKYNENETYPYHLILIP